MKRKGKIRVNITVDRKLLEKAKSKIYLFGGKLSTLFNAYLEEFVSSMDKNLPAGKEIIQQKIKYIEVRLRKLENQVRQKDYKPL